MNVYVFVCVKFNCTCVYVCVYLLWCSVLLSVCVREKMRERERKSVCVCVCVREYVYKRDWREYGKVEREREGGGREGGHVCVKV